MTESLGAILLSPKKVATGDPAGDALENLNTDVLGDGALCYVAEGPGQGQWQLQKSSEAVADGVTIVEPIAGPGRWFLRESSATTGITTDISGSTLTGLEQGREERFVVLTAPDENPVPLDLGRVIGGLAPVTINSSRLTTRLTAKITVFISRSDGSSWSAQEFLANWSHNSLNGNAEAEGIDELTNVGGTTLVVATVDDESPAGARLTFAQDATSGELLYYISLELLQVVPEE